MFKSKKKNILAALSLIIIFALSACSTQNLNENSSGQQDENKTDVDTVSSETIKRKSNKDKNSEDALDAEETEESIKKEAVEIDFDKVKEEDLDSSWNNEEATQIALNGNSAQISGKGATVEENMITINSEGTYVLSGKLSDGQILINAPENAVVRLVFNGTEISNLTSAPIYSVQADKLIITLADGTENIITDANNYIYENSEDNEPNAAIFSKTDLTINGTGKLTVKGNYNNGIASKDDLIIVSGTIEVNSVNHGIRGKDSVTVVDGDIKISSGNDGIQSNNSADAAKGWIYLINGNYNINSGHDGIQAETVLKIDNGNYNITTAKLSSADNNEDADSYKGLKASGDIIINNGDFNITAIDDALHSNSNVVINSGEFVLNSNDDGIHADENLEINNGNINIEKSYEGLEGQAIIINDGNIYINASDDGINASNGTSSSRGTQGTGNSQYIKINGGIIEVNASGDGIDSNGSIYMAGGELYISGPTLDRDGAIDYDAEFVLEGGTIIAAGASGMAEAPGTGSTQASVRIYFDSEQTGGKIVEIKDSNNNVIAGYTPTKQYKSLVISALGMNTGETYGVYIGSEKITDVTLTDVVTNVDNNGQQVSGGMMGQGGRGQDGGKQSGKAMQPDEDMQMPDNGKDFPDEDNMPPMDFEEKPQDLEKPQEDSRTKEKTDKNISESGEL